MTRFAKEAIEKITGTFKGLPVDLALIGSGTGRDIDIFVVNKLGDKLCASTKQFLDILPNLKSELDCEFIVKHEHKNFISEKNKRLVHLLYYPSYNHLKAWELPTFISCVHDSGEFCLGDNSKLKDIYKSYRARLMSLDTDVTNFHIYSYTNIAITNLIYLSINSNIFTKRTYCDNLIFVYRYSLREFLIANLDPLSEINFWEWDDLVKLVEKTPSLFPLKSLFKLKYNLPESLTKSGIKQLFIEYLKFGEFKLDYLNKLNIGKILHQIF